MKLLAAFLFILTIISCGGSSGGGTTTESDDVPDVEGTYNLTSITDACAGSFDDTIEVVQDGEDIILQATTDGFVDATGTIDENGDYTAEGTFNDGTPFTCEGTVVDDVASGTCSTDTIDCNMTYEKV